MIFIVELEGKAIGAAFTLSHKGTIEIPWASSLKKYNKLCVNEFMYWEIMKYSISRGIKTLDFGRCTKDSGTYRFKKQWGPGIKQLYWQYWAPNELKLPSASPQKDKFVWLVAIWKKLPIFVANRIGPPISRNILTF